MICKFGVPQESENVSYQYGNLFRHDMHTNWSRVVIAPNEHHVPLMLEIAKRWPGPYGILYVLQISRLGRTAARYQSPEPCSFDELEIFSVTFQDYFEGDGRHHIWFCDLPTKAQLIYDNHNLIYSYGNDDPVISLLKSKGLSEGNPRIPSPHTHHFNGEFDPCEDEIMKYYKWLKSPLKKEHDNP